MGSRDVRVAGAVTGGTEAEGMHPASGGDLVHVVGGAVSTIAPGTHVGSAALEASHVVAAAPCTLRSIKAINTSGVDLWLHVFDAVSLPAPGSRPSRTPVLVQAGATNGDTWEGGTALAVGCVAALSSTVDTLAVAGAVGWFDAEIN